MKMNLKDFTLEQIERLVIANKSLADQRNEEVSLLMAELVIIRGSDSICDHLDRISEIKRQTTQLQASLRRIAEFTELLGEDLARRQQELLEQLPHGDRQHH